MTADTFVFHATDKERMIYTIFIFRASYLNINKVRLINENGEIVNLEEILTYRIFYFGQVPSSEIIVNMVIPELRDLTFFFS